MRRRAVVPLLLCAIAGAALSCGDCPPATSPTNGTLPALRSRYVLDRVGTQTLPVVLTDNAAARVRLLADTLVFSDTTAASGSYTETTVLGTQQPPTAAEVVTRTVSGPRPWAWVRATGVLTLTGFSAGAPAATTTASPFDVVTAPGAPPTPTLVAGSPDGRGYTFVAR